MFHGNIINWFGLLDSWIISQSSFETQLFAASVNIHPHFEHKTWPQPWHFLNEPYRMLLTGPYQLTHYSLLIDWVSWCTTGLPTSKCNSWIFLITIQTQKCSELYSSWLILCLIIVIVVWKCCVGWQSVWYSAAGVCLNWAYLGRIPILSYSYCVKITCFTFCQSEDLGTRKNIWSDGAKCASLRWLKKCKSLSPCDIYNSHLISRHHFSYYQRDRRGEARYDLFVSFSPPVDCSRWPMFRIVPLLMIRDVFTQHKTTFCQTLPLEINANFSYCHLLNFCPRKHKKKWTP